MASHQPGQCCTVGVKHEGTPTGEMKSIGDTSVYFAYPKEKSTENCILFLTDVIGHKFVNAQLIADQFAANGYFTVMPDLFHGDPVPMNSPGFDTGKWITGPPGHLHNRVDPVVKEVIQALRSQFSVKRLGAVGYCFGAKYVARFMGAVGRESNATIDVGVMNHPSWVEVSELKEMHGPVAINAAQTDSIFTVEKRHEAEKVLSAWGDEKKLAYQINLYAGVSHGYAARGDVSDRRTRYAKEATFLQAVQWYDTWLKEGK